MLYFITGFITILGIFISIKALGFVQIQKKYWIKIVSFSFINTVILIIIQNCWSYFKYFSLIYLIIVCFALLQYEKNSILNSLFSIFISFFIYCISDAIIYPIIKEISLTLGIKSILIYRTGAYFIVIPCVYILSKLLGKALNKNMLNVLKSTVSNRFKKVVILGVGFNIFFLILIINIFKMFFVSNKNLMLASVLCFLGYSIIFSIVTFVAIYNLRKSLLDDQRETELKNVLEYNKNLEELYNDMRRFRHDYINILSSMAGYIEDGDIEGLEKYFDEKIAPLSIEMDKKNLRIGYLQNIKVKEIKGVLLTKTLKAQEMGIDVFVDVEDDINSINMDVIHICTILGILLDNALEEAGKFQDGYIKIGFVKKGNDIIIIISNKTSVGTPQVYKVFEKGFSTKGENRGIGLNNLRIIISKYKNVYLDTSISNGEFRQVIEVQ